MDFQSLGNTSVVGLQWGDEGKGKIVDLLTEHFDVVVRYAGGANAGHTVRIGDEKFALHLIPSGMLRPNVLNIIGPGVAVDLDILLHEIDGLRRRGVHVGENLRVSRRAHLVMPYHKKQDRLGEARLSDERKIGTTAKGIGPCYADKMLRTSALRVGDLYYPEDFREKVEAIVTDRNTVFAALYGDKDALAPHQIAEQWLGFAHLIAPHVSDTTLLLHDAISEGKRILFEGAQGSLLDITHGTFPYVTSSTCTAAGAAPGAGVAPSAINSYVGVVKAYSTRVGSGPFPSEQDNATGDLIRERGHEYGTTTGRPRRCGWFDAFATRYSVRLGGMTQVAVMHLDTLSTLPELKICTGYRHEGEMLRIFPADIRVLESVEPIFETFPGWPGEIAGSTQFDQLPEAAKNYLDRLEELLGVPITLVSTGPQRDATLHRESKIRSYLSHLRSPGKVGG
ncbi:MAG: adenylosuccinate synthase [Planctomycetia bacterium]|nr:adenylosuccinate synthase [Planctomycetia bacterium]MCC7316779.1 adenylosuccinate synthase [Planctomycetota bacterium]